MAKQAFPEPTVGALIFNPGGEVFLMKSHKWHNRYVIPGGHIEVGETMEKALRREIKEETGLSVSNIRFVSFREFILNKNFWKKRHFIFFNFTARTKSKKVTLNSEGQEYIWIKPKAALELPMDPYTRDVIKKVLSKK